VRPALVRVPVSSPGQDLPTTFSGDRASTNAPIPFQCRTAFLAPGPAPGDADPHSCPAVAPLSPRDPRRRSSCPDHRSPRERGRCHPHEFRTIGSRAPSLAPRARSRP
jgi:hypothetical protein